MFRSHANSRFQGCQKQPTQKPPHLIPRILLRSHAESRQARQCVQKPRRPPLRPAPGLANLFRSHEPPRSRAEARQGQPNEFVQKQRRQAIQEPPSPRSWFRSHARPAERTCPEATHTAESTAIAGPNSPSNLFAHHADTTTHFFRSHADNRVENRQAQHYICRSEATLTTASTSSRPNECDPQTAETRPNEFVEKPADAASCPGARVCAWF